MATAITICDDSKFARKQVNRALPADWPVSVHFATNGVEALVAIEQQLAEVLFLDLTMPVMDGIDVLESIHAQGLPTQVIVISADIQPAIRERVNSLGAIAFLQKPVDENLLIAVLNQHGIYTGQASHQRITAQKIERNDWVTEIINVAMGDAADRLARTLGFEITLSIPHVSEIFGSEIEMLLSSSQTRTQLPLVTQGFIGKGIAGECILFVEELNQPLFCRLLQTGDDQAGIFEALYNLAGMLNGSLLQRLFSQLGNNYYVGPPVTLHHFALALESFNSNHPADEKLLAIEINYRVASASLSCNQLIIFSQDACSRLDTILRTI